VPPIRIDDPFDDSRVAEVHLGQSPLKVVLFQVRFPSPITRLQQAIASGEIAQALSAHYPFADRQAVLEFVIQPGHLPSAQKSANSVMALADASQSWTLNIGEDSLSLTTTAYVNRDDLLERASVIFETLSQVARPPAVSRVGLRYVNRIEDINVVQKLCGNEGLAEPIRHQQQFSLANAGILSSTSEVQYAWNPTQKLQARWGILPPGQSVANPLDPLPDKSWLLDIDSFDEARYEFTPGIVVERLKALSERAYRYFRWFFTPESLPEFGAVND
jgi:uncharacterized protein (TIGR04255 family)